MKDNRLLYATIYAGLGALSLTLGIIYPDVSMFYGLTGAMFAPALLLFAQHFKLKNPGYRKEYDAKTDAQNIDLYDERKEMIRGKAARVAILFNWTLMSVAVFVVGVLGQFGYIDYYRQIIWGVTAYWVVTTIAMQVIYRVISKRY